MTVLPTPEPATRHQHYHQGQPQQPYLESLTYREREVAWLVSFALTDREIAARLFITIDTVKAHVKSICAKKGLVNRTAICRWVLVLQYEEKITLMGNAL